MIRIMKIITDQAKIEEILSAGVEEIIEREHLALRLKSGKQLRVKFGIDPTTPDLHIGHTVPLRKLRQFQDLGHKAVLIIGDSTAMIGDPSGRSETRKILSQSEVKRNMKSYLRQAGKVLKLKEVEVRHNSEWLDNKMTTILELSRAGTIQQVLHRSDFKKRIDNNQDITILEVLYPLLQGYDSVAIKADVELGGTDQKFNLLMGRRVQRYFKIPEQDILTLPLLEGIDGVRKMSKSFGNYIALDEKPNEMFGKIMSIPDSLITKYMKLCTNIPFSETEKIEEGLRNKSLNPKEEKLKLGKEIVKMYHSEKYAQKAENSFVNTFQKGKIPEEMTEVEMKEGETLMDVLVKARVVSSKSDFRRLVQEGAVINLGTGEKITDPSFIPGSGMKFKIGKRRFIKIF